MHKIKGGPLLLATGLMMMPFPGEYSKKSISKTVNDIKTVLEEGNTAVETIDSDLDLFDTRFVLAKVSGDISGEIYYNTSNPPVYSGCVPRPGYFGINLDVPDEKYIKIKKSLRKKLHPFRGLFLGF